MHTVRRITHALGSIALTVLAIVGAVSLAVWGLNTAGLMQPLIVVSGSMSPTIKTGDLLISGVTDPADIEVGEVTTLRSADSGDLVTHRVVEVAQADDGVAVRMKGDANNVVDSEEYLVRDGDPVWQPIMTIPGGGYFVATLMRPNVAAPIVLGILALCALALFPARPATPRRPAKGASRDAMASTTADTAVEHASRETTASTTVLTRRELRELVR